MSLKKSNKKRKKRLHDPRKDRRLGIAGPQSLKGIAENAAITYKTTFLKHSLVENALKKPLTKRDHGLTNQ